MVKSATALLVLLLSSGCAFEVRSVGAGNGGLDGDGGSAGSGPAAGGTGGALGVGGFGGVGGVIDELAPCTPATERTDCPGTSCDPATLRCSTFKLASRDACWTCVSDNDCESPDHRCVEMYFDGKRFPDAKQGFCMQVAVLEPNSTTEYDCDEPYETVLPERPSLSGPPTMSYCGIREDLTTCYALRAFENQEQCPEGSDDECPAGGICRTFTDGDEIVNCCTFECTNDDECPALDGKQPHCGGYCGD